MYGRTQAMIDAVGRSAKAQEYGKEDYQPLLERIGDARIVLLGEASHGTHEFYRMRAEITRHLIREKGFSAVAVEADWPDALRVNRYVRGGGSRGCSSVSGGARALESFTRFPSWMWRNREVLDFVEWLRSKNDSFGKSRDKVGFYGLDLYSSAGGVDVEEMFVHERKFAEPRPPVLVDCAQPEYVFHLEQNARLARNAAEYFEAVCGGQELSWNLRERHMADTLSALLEYLDTTSSEPAKIAVWVHNSHAGDARATQMFDRGELSLGQLMRERFGEQALLVGFTTYTGTVIAARAWGSPIEEMAVRPAHPESFEAVFHQVGIPRFSIDLAAIPELAVERRLQRAIGAVYLPDAELENHYFTTQLPAQFDYLFHIDESRSLGAIDNIARRVRRA